MAILTQPAAIAPLAGMRGYHIDQLNAAHAAQTAHTAIPGHAVRHCDTWSWCKRFGDHMGMGHSSDSAVVRTAISDSPYLDGMILCPEGDKPVIAVHLDEWHDLTPEQLRTETARIREQCDRLDALANLLDATEPTPLQSHARKLAALLAEHGVTQFPADAEALDEPMFVNSDGRRFLLVPAGADPAETLAYVREAFTAEASR